VLYAIENLIKSKRAEIIQNQKGTSLNLIDNGQELSIYNEKIENIIGISTGRPWKEFNSVFNIMDIKSENKQIIINGNLNNHIDVELRLWFENEKFLKINTKWTNQSGSDIDDTVLIFTLGLPHNPKEKITMAGNIYNNNPSADTTIAVPHVYTDKGKGYICEEHRLPIPAINVEWKQENKYRYLTLFSIPAQIGENSDNEEYWSLGMMEYDGKAILTGMSGALLFNGEKDIVYGFKNTPQKYEYGYFTFTSGQTVEKTYILDWGTLENEGRGFRNLIKSGYEIYKPSNTPHFSLDKLIGLKTNAMDNRWYDDGFASGYLKFKMTNTIGKVINRPPHFLYGWTGQCLKLAYCNALIGSIIENEKERLEQCRKAVSFYIDNSSTDLKELRYTAYFIDSKKWCGNGEEKHPQISSRLLGENMTDIGDIILHFKNKNIDVPKKWEESLIETSRMLISEDSLLNEGIYPAVWNMDGTPGDTMPTASGIPCVQAVIRTYEITKDETFLINAEKILYNYYKVNAENFEYPFARSTLDARCEDKEAGIYFFLAAYDLYRLTGREQYKLWAEVSADWILTYVYFWNPKMRKGLPCNEKGFNVTGWPTVSVQNQHLDVFFPSYEMWHFGLISGNDFYKYMGNLVFNACTQGICSQIGEWDFGVLGEQGEQYYQTNWSPDPNKWRGGFNVWNPSWVIAQVLKPALLFKMSIDN